MFALLHFFAKYRRTRISRMVSGSSNEFSLIDYSRRVVSENYDKTSDLATLTLGDAPTLKVLISACFCLRIDFFLLRAEPKVTDDSSLARRILASFDFDKSGVDYFCSITLGTLDVFFVLINFSVLTDSGSRSNDVSFWQAFCVVIWSPWESILSSLKSSMLQTMSWSEPSF